MARRLLGPPLWRSVATEVVIAVAVLVVTAILTGSPPAEAETTTRTVSATMVQGDLLADVSLIPARGANDLHLTFSPPGGTLDAVKDATARLELPERDDLGPLPIELIPAARTTTSPTACRSPTRATGRSRSSRPRPTTPRSA